MHIYLFCTGLAVTIVMLVTTCLMFLVIIMVWKKHVLAAAAFVLVFGSVELLYLSACIAKVHKGGWLPLVVSFIVLLIMCTWHYGTLMKHSYETNNKVCLDMLLSLEPDHDMTRVPGICIVYSNVVYSSVAPGVPPMFSHFVTNFPAFHQFLIFVSIRSLTVPRVPANQRFIVSRIGPPEFHFFQCIVQYGYKDARKDSHAFESNLIDTVAEFLRQVDDDWEGQTSGGETTGANSPQVSPQPNADANADGNGNGNGDDIVADGEAIPVKKVRFRGVAGGRNKELQELAEAKESGLAYMMGSTCVLATDTSSFWKKLFINIIYEFLRRNCRRPATALGVPHMSLIEVGMVYRV